MKTRFLYLALLVFCLSACQKDIDEFTPDETSAVEIDDGGDNIPTALAGLFEELETSGETFTVDPSQFIQIQTAAFHQVLIPANSILNTDGSIATGEVEIFVLFITEQGDMIRHRAPTVTTDGRLLESDAEIFVTAFQDGVELNFDPSQEFTVRVQDFTPETEMQFFSGERGEDGNVEWTLGDDDDLWVSEWGGADTTEFNFGYELLCDRFDWYNIDKFIELLELEESSENVLSVELPTDFGNLNAAVYAILVDFNAVYPLSADSVAENFTITGLPPGTAISIFVLGSIENTGVTTQYADVINTLVEADQIIDLSAGLTERTESEISSLLDGL